VIRLFREWLETVVETFLPFSCHVCRNRTSFGEVVCNECRRLLRTGIWSPVKVEDVSCRCPVLAMGEYESPLSDAIKAVKYRPSTRLLDQLANDISRVAAAFPVAERPEILIPVPLHPEREARRGFNQARRFAEILGGAWNARISPAVVRIRNTKPQAECNEEQRATNPAGAFALAEYLIPEAFAGKRLAIVDDVATTGATLDACVAVVEHLRPASLQAIVWAHSYRRMG